MKKLLCSAVLLAVLFPFATSQGQEKPLVPIEFSERIQLLSGAPMLMAAQSLGMTEIVGKDISVVSCPPGNANAKKLKDVGIGIGPDAYENEPTVVANPKDKKKLVAGSHFYDPTAGPPYINFCVAYYSNDRGATWSAPIIMPGLTPNSTYSDPVLAYAPDGSRVYYTYMDIKPNDYDIVVSYSDDDGQTWTGPIIALDGQPEQFIYDKCWIGTHIDERQSNWVYVTATQFDFYGINPDHIAFTRSSDKGITWITPPVLLDATVPAAYPPMVVQGSRPTGGVGSDVLVAWFHSGSDGWLTGSFEIRTAYSFDNGATFSSPVTAVVDNFECPFWLGPYASYHRWWVSMFPDVEIDVGGAAHIVYTHDPDQNLPYPDAYSLTPEDGDIRYITSGSSPYGAGSWSPPVTINDDGSVSAQGLAALETQHGGNSSTLHAIWDDHRMYSTDNLYYDMFYSRNVPGQGVGWFSNFQVNEVSSINDYIFIGDYNDLTANQTTLFGVWTDRRHQTSIYPYEDNVFGSRIIAGGGQGKEAFATPVQTRLPESYVLHQNYPNPFNPETEIAFDLPEVAMVTLKVYNVLGQEVAELVNGNMDAGHHKVKWDALELPSGVYFYSIAANDFAVTKGMVLMK